MRQLINVSLAIAALVGLGGAADAHAAAAACSPVGSPKVMTAEKFQDYVRLFNARDPCFAQYYSDDVVFLHVRAGVLNGRQAVLDFYNGFWKEVEEAVTLKTVVIDTTAGLMAAEIAVELRPKGDQPIQEGLNPGDRVKINSVIIYTLEGGYIRHIRGADQGREVVPNRTSAKR